MAPIHFFLFTTPRSGADSACQQHTLCTESNINNQNNNKNIRNTWIEYNRAQTFQDKIIKFYRFYTLKNNFIDMKTFTKIEQLLSYINIRSTAGSIKIFNCKRNFIRRRVRFDSLFEIQIIVLER